MATMYTDQTLDPTQYHIVRFPKESDRTVLRESRRWCREHCAGRYAWATHQVSWGPSARNLIYLAFADQSDRMMFQLKYTEVIANPVWEKKMKFTVVDPA